MYRRHDNCSCVVTYENGRTRQDVWSKKSWEAPETDKSEYKPEVLDYERAKAVEAQNMRFKGVDKSGGSGIIKLNRSINRKEENIGAFSNLEISMHKKSVMQICKKYSIDTKGLTLKIQRSEKMLSLPFYGSTDYDNIGRIDLLPNAFINEEQLVRTIIHEKCHVLQLQKYGKKYTQTHLNYMEKQAYRFENIFYTILRKRV